MHAKVTARGKWLDKLALCQTLVVNAAVFVTSEIVCRLFIFFIAICGLPGIGLLSLSVISSRAIFSVDG